ncbi:MAG: TonB-dependent receptor [Planctomycetota bacterium]|nr:TonB-dependent receptor [Planctomycetota bacterium]
MAIPCVLVADDPAPLQPSARPNASATHPIGDHPNASSKELSSESASVSGGLDVQPLTLRATEPDDAFHPVSFQDVGPVPVAAPQFQQTSLAGSLDGRMFGSPARNQSLLSQTRQSHARQPGTSVVLGSEAKGRLATDAGSLLRKSSSALGISTERRSPIVTDTRIRGTQNGQLLASGSYWFPVRQDLDTLLSKVDARTVSDVIVIKGPYSSRYGPGYSFVDFELLQTPRYENGQESHGTSSLDYNTNGEQWYGRQTFYGGDRDYGYRVGYGMRSGVDYQTGAGVDMPASYKSGDLDFAFGFDLDERRSLELSYMRLDQNDVQLANQINILDYLETDAFEVTYTERDSDIADLITVEGWYNTTTVVGNAQDGGKREQIPMLSRTNFNNNFDGWNGSAGVSASLTWDIDLGKLTAGADLRYLKQEYNELLVWDLIAAPRSNFQIPKSYSANPGVFFELESEVDNDLTVTTGGRLDWVNMNAETDTKGAQTFGFALDEWISGQAGSFNQSFSLGQLFMTANYVIDENITLNGGAGFGMRAPTMTEMYANAPFIAVMPQFALTSPGGNPFLRPEKRYQIDIGAKADYGDFRGGVNGFHAWVVDYITLDFAGLLRDPATGEIVLPSYGYTNTDLATLAGFEMFLEQDLDDGVTSFAQVSYTEGRDHRRRGSNFAFSGATGRSFSTSAEEPLFAMHPLEARLGLRITDDENLWGLELSARVVDNQDRVATSLLEQETGGFTTYDLRGYLQATEAILIVAGVENLTDKNYREHFDARNVTTVFQPGINFYLGTEVNY